MYILFCLASVLFQQALCQDPVLVMHRYESEDIALFKQWMVGNGKGYGSVEEHERRLSVFVENLRRIRQHNAEGHTWQMGVNEFTDLTFEEFAKMHIGSPQNCSATTRQSLSVNGVPDRKDWREEGNYVTPVKNQGKCGSCWTFSTTGCLESATAIHKQGHPLYVLSEQQLVDCATKFDDFGCEGGLPSHAFEYIRYNDGLESEADYPYKGMDSDCKFKPDLARAFVTGVVNITENDEDSIVTAVGSMNPVSVAFEVTEDFQHYKSGIYSNPKCSRLSSKVNHAVLAVGYDVDDSDNPYWIIKNSWGTTFGIEGYFYMERGSNMCGIATCASYPTVV